MVIALVLSLLALGFAVYLIRRLTLELMVVHENLEAYRRETQTITNTLNKVNSRFAEPPVATKTATAKKVRVRKAR